MTPDALYTRIAALAQQHERSAPPLDVFLTRCLALAEPLRAVAILEDTTFYALLAAAFGAGPPPLQGEVGPPRADYLAWRALVANQLADLAALALDDPQRYFGLEAPSGRVWYNFEPAGFVERGAAGTLGAYVEDDPDGYLDWEVVTDFFKSGQRYE